jgi:hypothetical protein
LDPEKVLELYPLFDAIENAVSNLKNKSLKIKQNQMKIRRF